MHISLTDRLEAWVREKVESGLYNNASEVIREALRTQMRTEATREEKLEALRAEIQKGLDDVEAGLVSTYSLEELKADRDAILAERASGAA